MSVSMDWYDFVIPYLDTANLASMSVACVQTYMRSHDALASRYLAYKRSDAYAISTIKHMNQTGRLIQEMRVGSAISTQLMFEYVMTCYENWSMLLEHKDQLMFPTNHAFVTFCKEHHLDIDQIIPDVVIHYTHVHRPTKSYAYYKSLV